MHGKTAAQEVKAQKHVCRHTAAELEYISNRRRLVAGDGRSGSIYLMDLLNTQDRLAQSQRALLRSQIAHVSALTQLRRVTGELLHLAQ